MGLYTTIGGRSNFWGTSFLLDLFDFYRHKLSAPYYFDFRTKFLCTSNLLNLFFEDINWYLHDILFFFLVGRFGQFSLLSTKNQKKKRIFISYRRYFLIHSPASFSMSDFALIFHPELLPSRLWNLIHHESNLLPTLLQKGNEILEFGTEVRWV